jgi:hypothetical protein
LKNLQNKNNRKDYEKIFGINPFGGGYAWRKHRIGAEVRTHQLAGDCYCNA